MSARAKALALLGRRDYTTFELRKKLLDREFSKDEVDDALRKLAADGLLDDRRAALAHIRTASRVKGRGRLRIQRELEARGVDRTLARELLAELPGEDEAAAIQRILQRRRSSQPDAAERRRLFQQLLRRGFSADLIRKALGRHDDET